jgi:hypothetical protein
MSHGMGDFGKYNWSGGSKKVQLWHGVAWKYIGNDDFKNSFNSNLVSQLMKKI